MIGYWKMGRQPHINAFSVSRRRWKLTNETRANVSAATQSAAPANAATFDSITDPEYLMAVFEHLRRTAGTAPGPDRLTYADLGRREVADCMRNLSRDLRESRWLPGDCREVRIPKASGGYRTLRMRNIFTRVIAAAITGALTPQIDPVFHEQSYGYRPGRSYWDLLAALYVVIEQTGRTVLVLEDVRDAFPSLSPNRVMYQFRQHVADQKLLRLIELVLRGEKATRANRAQLGVDQGSALSPLAFNLRMDHLHDSHMPLFDELPWLRYCDNLVYPCRDMTEGQRALTAATRLFHKSEFRLQQTLSPVDLRTESAQLLGVQISVNNGTPQYAMGADAWAELQHSLSEVHRKANPNLLAKEIAAGWISTMGPTLENASGDIPLLISQSAAQVGLREIQSIEVLRALCAKSIDAWHTLIQRERQRMRKIDEQEERDDMSSSFPERSARGTLLLPQ